MTPLGLYTVIYKAPDLVSANAWYSAAFGVPLPIRSETWWA